MQQRSGFTLIELLVVIAIFAVIMAMVAPAVLSTRELSRRNTCSQHLRQIWTAVEAYQLTDGTFPAGVITATEIVPANEDGEFRSWGLVVLEGIDQPLLAKEFTNSVLITSPEGKELRKHRIATFLCPSDPAPARSDNGDYAQSNYAGCHDHQSTAIAFGNSGLLIPNERFVVSDIPDGSCCTFLGGEFQRSPGDLGWASGTRGMLRNTGTPINRTGDGLKSQLEAEPIPQSTEETSRLQELARVNPEVARQLEKKEAESGPPSNTPDAADEVVPVANDPGGFGSYHPGGAFFLMADGRIRFLSQSIDMSIYQRLGNRADQSPVPIDAF